jgi:hypothetical protein
MQFILDFFIKYEIPIYLLLAIGVIFASRSLIRARQEMRESIYGLERETAHRHTSQAVTALVLLVLLGLTEIAMKIFMAPNLPAFSSLSTPTMNALMAQTNTISLELTDSAGAQTSTQIPTAQKSGCTTNQIMISSPKPGEIIKGNVSIIGTADIPNFGFFKYEFAPISTDHWITIQANREIKNDTELGLWDTSEVPPGDYILRLVVVDNQGEELPPCVVPLRVTAP